MFIKMKTTLANTTGLYEILVLVSKFVAYAGVGVSTLACFWYGSLTIATTFLVAALAAWSFVGPDRQVYFGEHATIALAVGWVLCLTSLGSDLCATFGSCAEMARCLGRHTFRRSNDSFQILSEVLLPRIWQLIRSGFNFTLQLTKREPSWQVLVLVASLTYVVCCKLYSLASRLVLSFMRWHYSARLSIPSETYAPPEKTFEELSTKTAMISSSSDLENWDDGPIAPVIVSKDPIAEEVETRPVEEPIDFKADDPIEAFVKRGAPFKKECVIVSNCPGHVIVNRSDLDAVSDCLEEGETLRAGRLLDRVLDRDNGVPDDVLNASGYLVEIKGHLREGTYASAVDAEEALDELLQQAGVDAKPEVKPYVEEKECVNFLSCLKKEEPDDFEKRFSKAHDVSFEKRYLKPTVKVSEKYTERPVKEFREMQKIDLPRSAPIAVKMLRDETKENERGVDWDVRSPGCLSWGYDGEVAIPDGYVSYYPKGYVPDGVCRIEMRGADLQGGIIAYHIGLAFVENIGVRINGKMMRKPLLVMCQHELTQIADWRRGGYKCYFIGKAALEWKLDDIAEARKQLKPYVGGRESSFDFVSFVPSEIFLSVVGLKALGAQNPDTSMTVRCYGYVDESLKNQQHEHRGCWWYSRGPAEEIRDEESLYFRHYATSVPGCSGSPIINVITSKVVGVHCGGNEAKEGRPAVNYAANISYLLEDKRAIRQALDDKRYPGPTQLETPWKEKMRRLAEQAERELGIYDEEDAYERYEAKKLERELYEIFGPDYVVGRGWKEREDRDHDNDRWEHENGTNEDFDGAPLDGGIQKESSGRTIRELEEEIKRNYDLMTKLQARAVAKAEAPLWVDPSLEKEILDGYTAATALQAELQATVADALKNALSPAEKKEEEVRLKAEAAKVRRMEIEEARKIKEEKKLEGQRKALNQQAKSLMEKLTKQVGPGLPVWEVDLAGFEHTPSSVELLKRLCAQHGSYMVSVGKKQRELYKEALASNRLVKQKEFKDMKAKRKQKAESSKKSEEELPKESEAQLNKRLQDMELRIAALAPNTAVSASKSEGTNVETNQPSGMQQ